MTLSGQSAVRPRPPRRRGTRTQEERRAAAQAKIVDAVIACLVEEGHAAVTFANVAQRAGVSRGAVLHHFPERASLMTAAIEHLWRMRLDEVRAEAERASSGGDRVARGLDLLWESYAGPLWSAALEILVAVRTDSQLRDTLLPLEQRLIEDMHRTAAELAGPKVASAKGFRRWTATALAVTRGLALLASHQADPAEVSATWEYARANLLKSLPTR